MTTNTSSSAKSAIESVAGALVWWEFETVLVKPTVMQAILAKHGMDIEIPVPAIDVTSAIRKAASSFTSGDRKERVRAKVIGTYDDGSIEVSIIRDYARKGTSSGNGEAGADQIDSVVFDTNAGQWLYGGTTEHAKRFIALADQKREFLGHDFVRRSVVHGPLAAMGAFPLRRKQGGFYFVPAGTVDKARVIEAIVNDIPAECEVMLAEINASTASRKSVGAAARDWLESGIGDLKTRLAAWKEASRTPRSDAVSNTLQEFSMLADHARLYRDALNLELGDLDTEMREAVEMAQEIAGVVNKGIPPLFITTAKALAATSNGAEVTWAAIAKTGLPENASNDKAQAWWTTDRGQTTLEEAGLKATVSETGLTFIDPTTEPEPEVEAAPEATEPEATEPEPSSEVTIESEEDDLLAQIAAMKGPDLRKALDALGQKYKAKAGVESLRDQYKAAIGLS